MIDFREMEWIDAQTESCIPKLSSAQQKLISPFGHQWTKLID